MTVANLVVDRLEHTIGAIQILKDICFEIKDGEFFTMIGPSGCGKSTTLMSLAGLLRPTGGSIKLGETFFLDASAKRFVQPQRRNVGLMFQSYALWPHMTVRQNLMFPLKLRKIGKSEANKRIDEVLELVEMLPYSERYPSELSGGQQQRVALGRTLVYGPSLLLLDEPLSNLDAQLRERARLWLRNLQRRTGVTTVYVTHDQSEALSLSDRIAILKKGELVQVGSPIEVYTRPADRFVADFIGKINVLTGTVVDNGSAVRLTSGDVLTLSERQTHADGQTISVGIRPERIVVGATPDVAAGKALIHGQIVESTFEGSKFVHSVQVGQDTVRAETTDAMAPGPVTLSIAPQSIIVFNA